MITSQDFSKFLKHLKIAIPKWAPDFSDPDALVIWYDAFKHYDLDHLRLAYRFCRDNCTEFPSIADLKMVCDEYSGENNKSQKLKYIDKQLPPLDMQLLVGDTLKNLENKNKTSILGEWNKFKHGQKRDEGQASTGACPDGAGAPREASTPGGNPS